MILEKERLENVDDCIYVKLPSGFHTVLVRSVDKSDNIDPDPAIFSWSVPTIHESINNIITEVKDLSLPSYFSRNMIDSLNKISEGLNTEDLLKILKSVDKLNLFCRQQRKPH